MNANAKAIRALMREGEWKIRLTYPSQGGLRILPSSEGYLLPEQVPPLLFGKARFDTFANNCRPMREQVDVYLPGGTVAPQEPAKPSGLPIQNLEALLAQLSSLSQNDSTAAQTETDDSQDLDNEDDDELREDLDPDLVREVAAAKLARVRSAIARQEALTDSEVEGEHLAVMHGSKYTQEVAEWQLLSSRTKAEFYRDARRTQEVAQRQVELADHYTGMMLRNADLVAQRLQAAEFQPPPPPKPQVDYGAVAIAGFQLMSTFVAGLTGMRQSPTPSAGLLPSPTPGTTTAESKQNAGDAGESFAISKNRLLELAESKALGLYGNSDALAKAIRDDKLDLYDSRLKIFREPRLTE